MQARTAPIRHARLQALLLLVALLALVAPLRLRAASPQQPGWRRSAAQPAAAPHCFDTRHPHIFVANEPGGSVAYNWMTGERRPLNQRPVVHCGPSGYFFAAEGAGRGWRFSLDDPQGHAIDFLPTHLAHDGSLLMYAQTDDEIWASADAGATWQRRRGQLPGWLHSIAVAEPDARAIYAAVEMPDEAAGRGEIAQIYFSADAGSSWQLRFERRYQPGNAGTRHTLFPIPGGGSPITTVGYVFNVSGYHEGTSYTLYISGDGARTFNMVTIAPFNGPDFTANHLAATPKGIVRASGSVYTGLTRSGDGGATWQPLGGAPSFPIPNTLDAKLQVAHSAPHNLFLSLKGQGLWHSDDSGDSWRKIWDGEQVLVSPYLPLTLLGWRNGALEVLELPDAGRRLVGAVPQNGVAGGGYFPETGHNFGGTFKRYWEANGALAQFGYPRTEPFFELNPADGRVYLVQYFERNRFEYHPELAGSQYEVLLGLLGNQFTTHRQSEPPFQRVPGATQPDAVYFPETGHTLRGAFRPYWEKHGGLAMYGYPISEEFLEVNEDDGRTYIVQYFERARFEYHEEHKNTRYEVLLGLLGNKLLREKGWE